MPIATPYRMVDFYGYDQDCSTLTSFTSANAESSLEGCNETLNQTYYHDGSGARPVANDTVYTDSAGTTTLSQGIYRLDNGTKITVSGGLGSGQGVVMSVDSCS